MGASTVPALHVDQSEKKESYSMCIVLAWDGPVHDQAKSIL